ncbi:MAG: glutathione S-transferase [Rhodobacterales bacterium 32-66-7]|nr:MAG: glutathione S-transferase [Rhodobacterales bacterium 32-66-7]
MTAPYTLVSFDLCPYVQRAAIVLAEKGIPFARRDVDLSDKPDWFTTISPLGKVPLLIAGQEVLFESAVIVEYLEEVTATPLHPVDPLARARHRAWMEVGSSILGDIWVVETTKDSVTLNQKITILRDKFLRVETALSDGPWFAGDRFSIVDAVFAPVFRYFDVFDQITDLGILTGLPKLAAWRAALAARPSVIAAARPDYPDLLRAFLRRHDGVLLRRT